jgi:hypothetical protein
MAIVSGLLDGLTAHIPSLMLQELYANVEEDRRAQADCSTLYALSAATTCCLCTQFTIIVLAPHSSITFAFGFMKGCKLAKRKQGVL